ncbi:MAG: hypothetical protein R3D86_14235 [Emcibacteraceae bacterium]
MKQLAVFKNPALFMKLLFFVMAASLIFVTTACSQAENKDTKAQLNTDYHVHIQSPEMGTILAGYCGKMLECDPETLSRGSSADDLLLHLKNSRINRVVIMSTAYQAAMPEFNLSANQQKQLTRRENDYIAGQISQSEKLLGFFSVNPLSSFAVEESQYWIKRGELSGLKLHFANSAVDLHNPEHIEKIQELLDAVDNDRMTILIHLRTRNPDYGPSEAEIFFKNLMPHIKNARVIIAHAGGWGGYDDATHATLQKFIEIINNNRQISDRIYLGVGAIIMPSLADDRKTLFVKTFRTLNIKNWLFGSDWFPGSNEIGYDLYLAELKKAGLTDAEITELIGNRLPFVQ